jgi:hypothetical protein
VNPTFFASPEEMRDWLEANHEGADELWVGLYKKDASKTGITMPEALDQALCYGWIDTKGRRIDDERWMVRFVPRRPKSNWSERNIARVEELIADGLMHEAGLRSLRAPLRPGAVRIEVASQPQVRSPRLRQALGLVLPQEALEQAAVALFVVEDVDHHVVGDGIDLVGDLDNAGVVLDRSGLGGDHAADH